MEKQKIARINALAKKAKAEGLTDAEKVEQKQLRDEYCRVPRQSQGTAGQHDNCRTGRHQAPAAAKAV